MYRIILLLLLLFNANWVFAIQENSTHASEQTFVFGVVPQHKALRSAARWQPLLEYISRHTGYNLQFSTEPTIDQFTQAFLDGEYDFVYINPHSYTLGHEAEGYCAFAKEAERTLRAIIVVRADNAIRHLRDLEGQKVAFPAEAAFASILLKTALAQLEIQVKPVYMGSHDEVYLSVYKGQYVAGGGVVRTFKGINQNSALRKYLKVFWKTEEYTGHALAAHPRVPHEAVGKILNVMKTLSDDAYGQYLLEEVKLNGIETAQDADWDIIRLLFSDIEVH